MSGYDPFRSWAGRARAFLWTAMLFGSAFGGIETFAVQSPSASMAAGAPSLAVMKSAQPGAYVIYPTLAGNLGGQDLHWHQFLKGAFEAEIPSGQWGSGALDFETDLGLRGQVGWGIRYQYESLGDLVRDGLGTATGSFVAVDSFFQTAFRVTMDLGAGGTDSTKKSTHVEFPLSIGIGLKLMIQDFGQTAGGIVTSSGRLADGLLDFGAGFGWRDVIRLDTAFRNVNLGGKTPSNGGISFPPMMAVGVAYRPMFGGVHGEVAAGWETLFDGTDGAALRHESSAGFDAWIEPSGKGEAVALRKIGGGVQVRQEWLQPSSGFGGGIHMFSDFGSDQIIVRLKTSLSYQVAVGFFPAISFGLHWEVGP